jgi:hypothetical protein
MQTKVMKSQNENKKRLEVLKSWMTSFVMTATILIVAIIYVPKSPKATIIDVQSFYDAITYQVLVTDEDMALDINTLNITLENQFEKYTYPLSLGLNVGVFDQLKPNTIYQMHVYGSKGFGSERLEHLEIQTKNNRGGAIVGYRLFNQTEFDLYYQVDVLIRDPEFEFTDIKLYYAYGFMEEEVDQLEYDFVEILDDRSTIELPNVPVYNATVYLYLEANMNGDLIVIDTLSFQVPYYIETALFLESVSKNRVHYEFYKDYNEKIDASYTIELHLGYQIIQTLSITSAKDGQNYKADIIFNGLKKNTRYQVIVKINYKDPESLTRVSKTIHNEEITTLDDYQISHAITDFGTYFEVYIYLVDPNHYFQIPFYTIFLEQEQYPVYIDGNTFGFTPDGNGKYVTFTINKPEDYPYHLEIGVRNQLDYSISHIIIDQIIHKP